MASGGKIEAVLFDMDGTLVDSEPLWHRADEAWLGTHGIELSDDEWIHIVGLGGGPFVRMLMDKKGLQGEYDQLLREKNSVFQKLAATDSVPFREMFGLAHSLKQRGGKIAVASASSCEIIHTTLACVGEADSFHGEFSSDMVEHSKPAPDLFLYAADKLGVTADTCLVIEDSQYGVEAGKRAGMTVVAVPYHIHDQTREYFEKADLLFRRGMKDFTAELVLTWLEDRELL